MTLERWIEAQEARGNQPGVRIGRTLLDLYGDIPAEAKAETAVQAPEDILSLAVQEYKTKPHSAEALTALNRAFYESYGRSVGLEISVPDCDWTEREIKKQMPTVEGKKVKSSVLYYPEELKGSEGLVRIGKMFGLTSWSVQENTPIVSDEKIPARQWIRIEDSIDAPNTNTNEEDLANHAQKHNIFGQDENIYILGSRFAKLLRGRYFDQGPTWSRLPGSRGGGRMVNAHCGSGGRVDVGSGWYPGHRDPFMGARFAGVKSS